MVRVCGAGAAPSEPEKVALGRLDRASWSVSRNFEAGTEPDDACVHPSLVVVVVLSNLIVPLETWYVFVHPRTGTITTEALTVCWALCSSSLYVYVYTAVERQ